MQRMCFRSKSQAENQAVSMKRRPEQYQNVEVERVTINGVAGDYRQWAVVFAYTAEYEAAVNAEDRSGL